MIDWFRDEDDVSIVPMCAPQGITHDPDAPAPTGPGAPASAGFQFGIPQSVLDIGRGLAQEGTAGLMDYQGMLDRQAAQRELAGNFEIIDPAHPPAGPRAENQVSEAEFEQIARTYSDIRLDRTHMHFDTPDLAADDAAQYRRDMMGQMGRIMQTETGREMIDGLIHNPQNHDLNFHTHVDDSGAIDPSNANAEPAAGEDAASTPGVGSDVDLNINPGVDHYAFGGPGGSRGDVTLFHEMTHAYHQLRGTDDNSGVVTEAGLNGSTRDADAAGTDDEVMRWEHQAVGLGAHEADTTPNENSYRAARSRLGAAAHRGIVAGDVCMPQRQDYND